MGFLNLYFVSLICILLFLTASLLKIFFYGKVQKSIVEKTLYIKLFTKIDYLYVLLVYWNFSLQSNSIQFYTMHVNNSYHENSYHKQKLSFHLSSLFDTPFLSTFICESLNPTLWWPQVHNYFLGWFFYDAHIINYSLFGIMP